MGLSTLRSAPECPRAGRGLSSWGWGRGRGFLTARPSLVLRGSAPGPGSSPDRGANPQQLDETREEKPPRRTACTRGSGAAAPRRLGPEGLCSASECRPGLGVPASPLAIKGKRGPPGWLRARSRAPLPPCHRLQPGSFRPALTWGTCFQARALIRGPSETLRADACSALLSRVVGPCEACREGDGKGQERLGL